jgi:hypothetical protein
MEGCHWTFRKAPAADWPKLLTLLLSGVPVRAEKATGWLIDVAGPIEAVLGAAWSLASGTSKGVERRAVRADAIAGVADHLPALPATESPAAESARRAILDCIRASCGATLGDARSIQAKHSAEFMRDPACQKGRVGSEFTKTMKV